MVILNPFKKKELEICGDKIKCKHGFYSIEKLQESFDSLIILSKLMGLEVKSFGAAQQTGYYLMIQSDLGIIGERYIDITVVFYMSSKRITSVVIDFNVNEKLSNSLFNISMEQTKIIERLKAIENII